MANVQKQMMALAASQDLLSATITGNVPLAGAIAAALEPFRDLRIEVGGGPDVMLLPIERLVAFKKERGWRNLKLYSDATGELSRDFHAIGPTGEDEPGLHVFSRRDGTIRHFWSGEMDFSTADPGQDPRGAPDLMPLWTVFDTTPEGRDSHWYPKLEYGR